MARERNPNWGISPRAQINGLLLELNINRLPRTEKTVARLRNPVNFSRFHFSVYLVVDSFVNMSQEELTLESLATSITKLSNTLTQGLKDANFPQPSFAADAPAQLPPNPAIQGPRLQLVEALMKMLHLAMGPSEYFLQLGLGVSEYTVTMTTCNLLSAQAVFRYLTICSSLMKQWYWTCSTISTSGVKSH